MLPNFTESVCGSYLIHTCSIHPNRYCVADNSIILGWPVSDRYDADSGLLDVHRDVNTMQPNHDSWLPTGLGPAAIIGLAGLFTWCDSPGIHNSPMPPCIELLTPIEAPSSDPMPAACRRNYHSAVTRAPHIVVGEGALKHLVLPHCSHLLQPYRPTAWASSRHMQTVIGREWTCVTCTDLSGCPCSPVGSVCLSPSVQLGGASFSSLLASSPPLPPLQSCARHPSGGTTPGSPFSPPMAGRSAWTGGRGPTELLAQAPRRQFSWCCMESTVWGGGGGRGVKGAFPPVQHGINGIYGPDGRSNG